MLHTLVEVNFMNGILDLESLKLSEAIGCLFLVWPVSQSLQIST